jgi:hypothetical protein
MSAPVVRPPIAASWRILLVAVAIIASTFAAAAAGPWKGQEVQKEGVLHVMNPAAGMEDPVTVDLMELWRLGGETDNEDEFFGIIARVATDAKNNVYVLDAQLSEIKVYDADGQLLRTMGREGEGPGEFRRASDMFFMPDGKLGVIQLLPGKIVLLTPEGDPGGDFPLPATEGSGMQILLGARLCSNQLVMARQLQEFGEGKLTQKLSLDRVDLQGKVTGTYLQKERVIEFANMLIDEKSFMGWEQSRRWDAGSDGRVYALTGGPDYLISVYNPDGKTDRIIQREYKRRTRSAEEIARVHGIFEAVTRQAPNAKVEVNDFDQDIDSIYPREDGSLWVLSSQGSRGLPSGVLGVFDVFDAKGRYVRQVTLRGQGNPEEDGYFFVGDRLYVVTGWLDAILAQQGGGAESDKSADAAPMELICYRIEAPMIAKGK